MVLAGRIVPAHDPRRASPGGLAVREFAAPEYRREEFAGVAVPAHRLASATTGGRSRGSRLGRRFGAPRETEGDGETIADPGPV